MVDEIIEEPVSTKILTSEHLSAYFLVLGSDKKPGKNRFKIKDFEMVNDNFQGFESADITPGKKIVYLQLQSNCLVEIRSILGKEDITREDIKSVCKSFIGFTKADCFAEYGDKLQPVHTGDIDPETGLEIIIDPWADQVWSCDKNGVDY